MFENKYPYTDFHELNLDWFLAEFKKVYIHVDNLDATVKQFTEFVTNYFNNLDVQEEINKKLDAMTADGSLAALIQPLFDEYKTEIDDEVNHQNMQISSQNTKIQILEGRMDEFSTLTEGSTTGDAELADIRADMYGDTHSSAGNSVRNSDLGFFYGLEKVKIEVGSIKGAGNTYAAYTGKTEMIPGHIYRFYPIDWSHDNITQSPNTHLFDVGYSVNGVVTALKFKVTNENIPEYYEFKMPDVSDALSYFGGRLDSGSFAKVLVIDITDDLNFNFLMENSNFVTVYSAGNNVWTKVISDIKLKENHFYKVTCIDWNRDDVPYVGSGILYEYGWNKNGTDKFVYKYIQTEPTIPKEQIFKFNDTGDCYFTVGGRVSADHVACVMLTDLTEYIPEYVETMIASLNTSLKSHQTSNSVSFGFMTDIHVGNSNINSGVGWAMLMSKIAINEVVKKNPISFILENGDYLNNSSTTEKLTAESWYNCLNDAFLEMNVPQYRSIGNHDLNDINTNISEQFTLEEFYKIFMKGAKIDNFRMKYGSIKNDYGYYDDVNRKIRIFFLNTVDLPEGYDHQHEKGMSNEQINFVADNLNFNESGWSVVFTSHHALRDNSVMNPTESEDAYVTPNHGGEAIMGVINAFISKTTYQYVSYDVDFPYNVDVDFTGNQSNEVILLLSGHTHRDVMTNEYGYVMMSSAAAGLTVPSYGSDGTQYVRSSRNSTETSWDIITIDRNNKKIYADRYGSGSNREITYS